MPTLLDQSQGVVNGLYRVGDQVFTDKIPAILHSEKVNQPVLFDFYDDSYQSFDWRVEPTQSLKELYAARAWELRNQYDYLVLRFSGGGDSMNILETFINNQIPLDEIITWGPLDSADKNPHNRDSTNTYAESIFQAWPLMQWAKKYHMPNVKLTVFDSTRYTLDYFDQNPHWYTKFRSHIFLPNTVFRSAYDEHIPHHRALLDQGKKICHVVGIEKPQLYLDGDEFKVRFLDKHLNFCLPKRNSDVDLPEFQEPFYWSRSTGPLVCKQAHVLKRAIKSDANNRAMFSKSGREYHDWVNSIIYERSVPILWQPNKTLFGARGGADYFFKHANSQHVKHWEQGMAYFRNLVPQHWIHDNTQTLELLGVWSPSYSVGF